MKSALKGFHPISNLSDIVCAIDTVKTNRNPQLAHLS